MKKSENGRREIDEDGRSCGKGFTDCGLYDLEKDIGLIEASFAMQYGIRLRREKEMSAAEFAVLLAGLMPETPLGIVVRIRAEKDMKVVAGFGKEERKIWDEWKEMQRGKMSAVKADAVKADGTAELQRVLAQVFG